MPIKTVKLLILVNVFKSTKERKYFRINIIINVREDSDRVKMNLKLCRNQSIDAVIAFSPTRVFQISRESPDKNSIRSATSWLDKLIKNL